MSSGFAAQAEGYFDGACVSSLGKAGINKDGTRKPIGCTTLESAKQRAINAVLNRLRYRRYGGIIERLDFLQLEPELYNQLKNEIVDNVVWKYHSPSDSYITKFDIDGFVSGTRLRGNA